MACKISLRCSLTVCGVISSVFKSREELVFDVRIAEISLLILSVVSCNPPLEMYVPSRLSKIVVTVVPPKQPCDLSVSTTAEEALAGTAQQSPKTTTTTVCQRMLAHLLSWGSG